MNFSGPSPYLFTTFLDVPETGRTHLHRLLNADERNRAASFHFERDRIRWATARAVLRLLLAEKTGSLPQEVGFAETATGKPFLSYPDQPGLAFNLSHAADHVLIVFSDCGPVGVDLELFSRGSELEDCLASFCSGEEIRQWESCQDPAKRRRLLVKTWCGKEAFLKALGLGLTLPPESLMMEWINPGCAMVRSGELMDAQFHIHFPPGLEDREFCAAVALPVGMPCPPIRRFDVAPQT